MNINLAAAVTFVTTHGRVLDRRRMATILGDEGPDGALAALDAYRNLDGGYGWGLEPDLRSPESQPVAAMHAFEVFAEAAPSVSVHAETLCDWLASVSHHDSGVPFALPLGEPAGSSPWWAQADTETSSLQITASVAAAAHRVARHDPAVAGHPWLDQATSYCKQAIEELDHTSHAYVISFALQLLDAVAARDSDAEALLRRLGRLIPADGTMPVDGGIEGEVLRPLDYAPDPDRPVRQLVPERVMAQELERLASQQRPDGGWPVEWATASPAGALEWRGYLTVRAVAVLRRNGAI